MCFTNRMLQAIRMEQVRHRDCQSVHLGAAHVYRVIDVRLP